MHTLILMYTEFHLFIPPPPLSLPPSGMSQYIITTRAKISSATAMLALSEQDMEKKLGISNPLHRRKLKLALDYQKAPEE